MKIRFNSICLISACLFLSIPVFAELFYRNSFQQEPDLKDWKLKPGMKIADGGLCVASLEQRGKFLFAAKEFDPAKLSGKFFRLTGEIKGEKIPKAESNLGVRVQFTFHSGTERTWSGAKVPFGNFGWTPFECVDAAPHGLTKAVLNIGLQNSSGKIEVRNLKLELLGSSINIKSAANQSLKDDVAGDGKGGWCDQGPAQDGRQFAGLFYSKLFIGIPFRAERTGKSLLVMHSPHFPQGIRKAEIAVSPVVSANYLYLMHTLAWAPRTEKEIGHVILTGTNGKSQRIPVLSERDAGDWLNNITHYPNGYCGVQCRTDDNKTAGLFLSRFKLDPSLGPVKQIAFESASSAIWIIAAATLSENKYSLPESKLFETKASASWIPFSFPEQKGIRISGSALDLTPFLPSGKAGEFGRVIVAPDGHLTFEKAPERRIRFFTYAGQQNFSSHEAAATLAREIRKNGYNMIRTHFLDWQLMSGAKKPLEFNPDYLDRFFYFIKCLKDNGIYLNFDCMTSWAGYTPGHPWLDPKLRDNRNSFKSRICFDPAVRENWRKGVEILLRTRNPYTGTRLVEDPVLAMTVGFNEQEFAFRLPYDEQLAAPFWHAFLKKRYANIDSYNQKQKTTFRAFEEIPCPPPQDSPSGDAAQFRFETESEISNFFESELRKMGYRGLYTNFNCMKTQPYNRIRRDTDYVAINGYHAHPYVWGKNAQRMPQESVSGTANRLFRDLISVRQKGLPLVVTEYNAVFCNRYRYEQPFAVGAYAAFQNIDALTCHGTPVSQQNFNKISAFALSTDPMMHVSEFLTYFLFMRGDITPASHSIRVIIPENTPGTEGMLSGEQTRLALVTGFEIENRKDPEKGKAIGRNETAFPVLRTEAAVTGAGFSMSSDHPSADAGTALDLLRKKGHLPMKNLSDGKSVFESSTGELFLDAGKNFIRIDTPRFQGICGEAGAVAVCGNLKISRMTTRGNLSLVSVDGTKSIAEASRLVLVYATNILNSGMLFSSPDMGVCLKQGKLPALLERGAFTVELRHNAASKLKMYPLDLSGKRGKEIPPDKSSDASTVFSFDSGKDGAYLFFELIRAD